MGLQEQNISFKFAGGVESKMDSKAVPATRLLALENGVFTKAVTIKKRNGYDALSKVIDGSATLISGVKKLATRDDEILQFNASNCYSKQSGADQWTDMGTVVCATSTDRGVVQTSSQQTMPDHATLSGVTVYAWEDSRGGVYWTVTDATGTIHRAATQADALGQRPRCVAVGALLHTYYAVPTQNKIMVLVINPSNPAAAVTPVILVDDLNTNPVYDVCVTNRTGTPAVIAWHERSTTNFRLGYIDSSGVLGSATTSHPGVITEAAVLKSDTPIAVAFSNFGSFAVTAQITVAIINSSDELTTYTYSTDATTITPTASYNVGDTATVKNLALTYISTRTIVVLEQTDGLAIEPYCISIYGDTTSGSGILQVMRSVSLASRAFTIGTASEAFAVFIHDTTYFNTYLTLRLTDAFPVGRHTPGGAAGVPPHTHLSSAHVTDSVATVTLPYKTRLQSVNNDKFGESALRQISLNFDDSDAYQTSQIGQGLYMAGACPLHYDGRAWYEQGFHYGPDVGVGFFSGIGDSGGSSIDNGTYQYKAWYEWTDAQGEVHRGPESVGISVELTGGDTQVILTIPTLRITQKTNVRVCVARSLDGDTSRLFRVTSLDPTTEGDVNGYVANDKTVDTVTFTDSLSDEDLQEQEPHYTNGGILSNDPTAVGALVCNGKNRLFFNDCANGHRIRFSQRIAEGFGLELAPELYHDVDPSGGNITALAAMDDTIIIFKHSAIYAFNGDGPLENGSTATSGFSAPVLITTDVGCTDPSSVVLTPTGLMFKSSKGIYMLGRDRAVTYVGAPVEFYNSQTVRRGTVMPDRSQVVFLTDSGQSLLYDYLFGQWSTFTNHEGYDAVVVDGRYYYLRTNDIVYAETIDEYADAGSRITLKFETAWLHLLEHLQGFQRFWKLLLLGTWYSPHQLGIQYRTNFVENWSDPQWLDATDDTSSTGWLTGEGANEIGVDPIGGSVYGEGVYGNGPYGGTAADVYQWRFGIHEDGQAIQFRFQDFEKSGLTGASFELTEMTIVGGVKKPDMRPFSKARSV